MRKVLYVIGSLLLSIVVAEERPSKQEDTQKKFAGDLRTTIFKRYDPKALPAKNPRKKISVAVNLEPIFIRSFDEVNQILVLDAYVHMKWKDDHLKWNAESHQEVGKLIVPSTDIWTPDLTIIAEKIGGRSAKSSHAVVYNSGKVLWVPLVTFDTYCPINMSHYPEDIQTCNIHIHSQSYDTTLLDLTMDSSDEFDTFQDRNSVWSLLSLDSWKKDINLSCCEEDLYSAIQYDITLKRKQSTPQHIVDRISYYAIFLCLVMFWLPPDSLHKVLLGTLSELILVLGNFYLGITLQTSEAQRAATNRVYPLMCFVASGLCAEILIINMARMLVHCRPSRCLLGIAKCCCQPFCVCMSQPYTKRDIRMATHMEKGKKHTPTAQEEWNVIAMACDRVLFLTALAVTIFFYKFW